MTAASQPLDVRCRPDGGGWACSVRVGDDPGATQHEVGVSTASMQRLDPSAPDPERLVRASFDFLLMREPREAILREFELPVIGRYFPGWEDEVRGALST
jgi:hypothetical protein